MTLEMPEGLQEALSWLGMSWPQADEDKLNAAGRRWTEYAQILRDASDRTTGEASKVWKQNTGDATTAFQNWWNAHPKKDLDDAASGTDLIGSALHSFAAITIALKGVYIAQLVILAAEIAEAIVTAVFTFGASLAEIPGFAAVVRAVVEEAVGQAVSQVVG